MAGSITAYETAAGKRYRVRFRKPDNSQTDKRGFRTKRDAELFLASTEVSIARGEYIDVAATRALVGPLGEVWLKNQSHLKASSWRSLEVAWHVHVEPRWGRTPVAAIRYSDVQSWVTELGTRRGATTVTRAYGVLAGILDVAVKDRRLLTNAARGANLPGRSSGHTPT